MVPQQVGVNTRHLDSRLEGNLVSDLSSEHLNQSDDSLSLSRTMPEVDMQVPAAVSSAEGHSRSCRGGIRPVCLYDLQLNGSDPEDPAGSHRWASAPTYRNFPKIFQFCSELLNKPSHQVDQ